MSAYDGDYANPRKIQYSFTIRPTTVPGSFIYNTQETLASYFEMNPDTGALTLQKDLQVGKFLFLKQVIYITIILLNN